MFNHAHNNELSINNISTQMMGSMVDCLMVIHWNGCWSLNTWVEKKIIDYC